MPLADRVEAIKNKHLKHKIIKKFYMINLLLQSM